MSLKLISLNVEYSKHLEEVTTFLRREQPDVVCIQELNTLDIPLFENLLQANSVFILASKHREEGGVKDMIEGQGIFSTLPLLNSQTQYYAGDGGDSVYYVLTDAKSKHDTQSYGILSAQVEKNGERFTIATTHFPWTPDGSADDNQRADLRSMISVLNTLDEFVLCGDFNAPRGGEVFSALASRYKDNIPSRYETSLDVSIHRAGKERPHEINNKMVDGLFTTPAYEAHDVSLEFGISDHAAIVATIAQAGNLG